MTLAANWERKLIEKATITPAYELIARALYAFFRVSANLVDVETDNLIAGAETSRQAVMTPVTFS